MQTAVVYLRKYSEDEPRDDHGRWTAGGGSATEPQASQALADAFVHADALFVRGVVDQKLKELGMSEYPVKFSMDKKAGSEVLAATGFKGSLAAEFHSGTHGAGGFTFYVPTLAGMSSRNIANIVEHEAFHARLHYASRVPASRLPTEQFIKINLPALQKEDGNTQYSRAHWKVADRFMATGPYTVDKNGTIWRAVNESLAEMHATHSVDNYPTYAKLDRIVNARWDRRSKEAGPVSAESWALLKLDKIKAARRGRQKYSEDEPRDDHGRWTTGGSSGEEKPAEKPAGEKPQVATTIDEAIALLGEGKGVQFERPEQVVTLLAKIAQLVDEAKALGAKAPVFDLCKVSVSGTNLFCSESVNIPRDQMPQLTGKPEPGTIADSLPKSPSGSVDLSHAFHDYLIGKGVTIEEVSLSADRMRASQNQLDGSKVATMARAFEDPSKIPTDRMFVSNEHYIVDGHHRWAAQIGVELKQHGTVMIPTYRVNMKILNLLKEANEFTARMGIKPRALGKALRRRCDCEEGVVYLEKYSDEQPRDDHGRWTSGGGSSEPAPLDRPHLVGSIAFTNDEVTAQIKTSLENYGMAGYPTEYGMNQTSLAQLGWTDEQFKGSMAAGWFHGDKPGGGRSIGGEGRMAFVVPQLLASTNRVIDGVVAHESAHARMHYANAKSPAVLDFIQKNAEALRSEDGTTAYARQWWGRVTTEAYIDRPPENRPYSGRRVQATYGNRFYSAVNESLAEMHYEGNLYKDPRQSLTPTYAKLDKIIMARWNRRGSKAESTTPKYVSWLLQKYSDEQPRDDHGRWTSGGGGTELVSPNVQEGLSFEQAVQQMDSTRQREIVAKSHEVDNILGLSGRHDAAVGAWKDGAENSIVVSLGDHPSFDNIEVSAAMKGMIADQKAVIPFHVESGGPDAMYRFTAGGDMRTVHADLEKMGIEYHTLQPAGGRTQVWVFDQGSQLGSKMQEAQGKYGSVELWKGRGEFLGGATRDSGRAAYEKIISHAHLGSDQRGRWERLYSGWRETHPVLHGFQALAKYSEDEPRDDHGRWSSGGAGTTSSEKPLSPRAKAALETHKPSTKEKQTAASAAERQVAAMLGGVGTGDNLPVDVMLVVGGKTYGVEVKSVQDNGNNKITMHPESLARKEAWASQKGHSIHTVVVDTRHNAIYYRKGVGSFRLHTLTRVDSAAHLRLLMGIKKSVPKYNEDQPRIPGGPGGGEWTSGGGGAATEPTAAAGPNAPSLPLRAQDFENGPSSETSSGLSPAQQSLNQTNALLDNTRPSFEFENDLQGSKEGILALADGLKDNPDWQAYVKSSGGIESFATESNVAVRDLLELWAETSGDTEDRALLMQQVAQKTFGLSDTRSTQAPLDPIRHEDLTRAGYSAFLNEMYKQTQADLDKAGIKELYLVRGSSKNRFEGEPRESELKLAPLSSFSVMPSVAENFTGGNFKGTFVITRIPASRVLSTARTGIGTLTEAEIVVLGGKISGLIMSGSDASEWRSIAQLALHGKKSLKVHAEVLDLDADLEDADWTKTYWNLPRYKSPEFLAMLQRGGSDLHHFRTLPVYRHAVTKGWITDDEWTGPKP